MIYTLYCHHHSPGEALEFLGEMNASAEEEEKNWSASFEFRGDMLRKKKTVTIRYDHEQCSPPQWEKQIEEIQNELLTWQIDDKTRQQVMALVNQFGFSLSITIEPEIEVGYEDDPRLDMLHALADQMDAVFFTPGALLDSQFRPIAASDGKTDSEAVIPE